jgi:hypothetical protein
LCNGSDLGEKNAKDALQKAPNQQKLVSSYPSFLVRHIPLVLCKFERFFSCGFFQNGIKSNSHLHSETKKGIQPKSEAQNSLRKEASTEFSVLSPQTQENRARVLNEPSRVSFSSVDAAFHPEFWSNNMMMF